MTSRRPSGHPTDEVANRGVKDQGDKKHKKIRNGKNRVVVSWTADNGVHRAPRGASRARSRENRRAFFSQGFFRAMGIDVVARYVRESGRSRRRAKPWFRQDRPQEIPRSLGGGTGPRNTTRCGACETRFTPKMFPHIHIPPLTTY